MGLFIGIHPMYSNGGAANSVIEQEDWLMTEGSEYIACENNELIKLE